jgi:hypothetical protein
MLSIQANLTQLSWRSEEFSFKKPKHSATCCSARKLGMTTALFTTFNKYYCLLENYIKNTSRSIAEYNQNITCQGEQHRRSYPSCETSHRSISLVYLVLHLVHVVLQTVLAPVCKRKWFNLITSLFQEKMQTWDYCDYNWY